MRTEHESTNGLIFRWNPEETIQNQRVYGLSFHEASTVFADPDARALAAPGREAGYNLICGRTEHGRRVVVTYRERWDQIWLFAARPVAWIPKKQEERPGPPKIIPLDFSQGEQGKYAMQYRARPVTRPPKPPLWKYWADTILRLVAG